MASILSKNKKNIPKKFLKIVQNHSTFSNFYRIILIDKQMLNREVPMNNNVEKLAKLRDIAILTKDPLQFGLTSLLINIEYGTEFENIDEQTNDKAKDEEMTLN